MQITSKEEFNNVSKTLLTYSQLIHDRVIHNRRNRVYQFKETIVIFDISIPRIEIFEPKPGAEIKKLKPGIEHIAFKVDDYKSFINEFKKRNIPIDKEAEYEKGSFFFKTKLIDLVEIEFRNDFLGIKKSPV